MDATNVRSDVSVPLLLLSGESTHSDSGIYAGGGWTGFSKSVSGSNSRMIRRELEPGDRWIEHQHIHGSFPWDGSAASMAAPRPESRKISTLASKSSERAGSRLDTISILSQRSDAWGSARMSVKHSREKSSCGERPRSWAEFYMTVLE